MGMSKIMLEQSDKMWQRAEKIMHFMLHRGSNTADMSDAFKLSDIKPNDVNGEVKALARTLATLKTNFEDIFSVHKHANNKQLEKKQYDPSVILTFIKELTLLNLGPGYQSCPFL